MDSKIRLVARGLNVSNVYWALQSADLWNKHTTRTEDPSSPHFGLDDIWVRYGDPDRAKDGMEHDSYWYKEAEVNGVREICYDLMHALQGDELGGVLITRIPAGKECKPHTDPGWHARRYDKYGVQITSAPGQMFCFDDASLETRPGDVFWFDNKYRHWVTNPTQYERITMIVCIRKAV